LAARDRSCALRYLRGIAACEWLSGIAAFVGALGVARKLMLQNRVNSWGGSHNSIRHEMRKA
jgi:hypothetical protein